MCVFVCNFNNHATKNPSHPAWLYWYRYPFLFDQAVYVGGKQWNHNELGYLSWWFRHLPHFACKNKDGLLNNWWDYIIDYPKAVQSALNTDDCNCDHVHISTPTEDILENKTAIWPNPADNKIFIDAPAYGLVGSAFIYAIDGKRCAQRTFTSNEAPLEIFIGDLASGSYSIQLMFESDQSVMASFIKK